MISTRGRYALRILIDLAENRTGAYIPLKAVAQRQEISLKYIEKLMPVLTKAKLVVCVHGKGGGYQLARAPEDYRVGEVLRLMEGGLAPTSCLACGATPCPRAACCRTLPMWKKFYDMTCQFFDGIRLSDLMEGETHHEYFI